MALSIPIISSYDGDGVSKAIKSFQQLETNSEKAQFAIKKAAIPAAAAIAGLTVALGDAVQAAISDTAAQEKLAGQLARTTGATDAQIKANEDWISTRANCSDTPMTNFVRQYQNLQPRRTASQKPKKASLWLWTSQPQLESP